MYDKLINYGVPCLDCDFTLTSWNTEDWGREGGLCDECCERRESREAERWLEEQREERNEAWRTDN